MIAQGLAALAILGEVDDPRDLTFYLAALHYSALRLGIDTRKLFGQAASLSPSTFFGEQMRGFPTLPPASRDLGAYRLRDATTGEGFDIVPPNLRRLSLAHLQASVSNVAPRSRTRPEPVDRGLTELALCEPKPTASPRAKSGNMV